MSRTNQSLSQTRASCCQRGDLVRTHDSQRESVRELHESAQELPVRPRVYAERPQETMTTPEALASILVAHHRELLAFVERRVHDRALAEEILQDAFVRGIEKADEIRDSALGWMYRTLRNAIIDRARRGAVQRDRLPAFAAELELQADPELADVACKCVSELARTLKPEYADALQRVDIDGLAVKDYADALGITASNAGVRVFRARDALRAQVAKACGTCATHGCIDCTCNRH